MGGEDGAPPVACFRGATRFRSLRDWGITWRLWRGDNPFVVQRNAGHKRFSIGSWGRRLVSGEPGVLRGTLAMVNMWGYEGLEGWTVAISLVA